MKEIDELYDQVIVLKRNEFLKIGGTIDTNIYLVKNGSLKIYISKNKFVEFINENEKNKRIWISILERLILQQLEREIDLLTTSPKERYNRILKRSPSLFQKISNKQIANYLRMTPETLSRLKKA